jgi:translocation and assembly module TamA
MSGSNGTPESRAARRGRRAPVRLAAGALVLLGLGACASDEGFGELDFAAPETQVDYAVELSGAPDDRIAGLMEQSLALYRQQEEGAASLAFLRRRAQGDVETAQRILRSRGYYDARIETRIEPPGTAESGEDGETRPTPAVARVAIEPGPQFTLASQTIQVIDTAGRKVEPLDAAALGAPVGGPAEAAAIVAAEQAAVARLRREGRPYAEFRDRDAVADLEAATLEVESVVAAGPFYRTGELRFEGAPNVSKEYLRTYVPWEEGAVLDREALAEYQNRLFGTGLFAGASVEPPEEPPEGETAPIIVRLDEAPFRSVAFGARFSTDEGPALRALFEHRNLFGANETLTLEADAGLGEQRAFATLLKPQYLRDGQDFTTGLEIRRVDDDAFDELGATLTAGLRRELGEHWTVGASGLLEASRIDDSITGESNAFLAGLPVFAAYDSTESELDPVQGLRARATVTPFAGLFDADPALFTKIEARGSAYQSLDNGSRFVLAERVRLGAIINDDLTDIPATRRFYAGGGGSVRGYEQDLIGPLDPRNDPTGGLSVAEAGLELRARIWGDIGGVVFAEAGVVGENTLLDLSEGVQTAAGLGFRYYSPVGPIRLDVAFPLNGRDVDDAFQAYIAIGQAF